MERTLLQAKVAAMATKGLKPAGRTPTSPEHLVKIEAMFVAVQETVECLAERWSYEHEYEEIAEYSKPILPLLPKGFALKRMTKRPFGFEFTIGTSAVYAVFATAKKFGWKRIS